jgi:hypothetical protein
MAMPDGRLAAARGILRDYETWTARGGTADWQAWCNRLAQAASSAIEIAIVTATERDVTKALNHELSECLLMAVPELR